MADDKNRDVYFEFTVVGEAVRVSAIDSVTGIEVVGDGAGERLAGRPAAARACAN